MTFTETNLKGSYTIDIHPVGDDRGWFARTYCKDTFSRIGHNKEWVQINHSYSAIKGTVRGLHFQISPHREIKLVRCISGEIFDVIVDLRENSATFLQWYGITLSAKNKKMLYIPEGFAHGFQTLTNDCELIYHHSAFYNAKMEGGLHYQDPKLNIDWPADVSVISERDLSHQLLTENFKGI